jgi:hypothetical protein
VPSRAQPNGSDDPWEAADPALALALQELRWYARNRNRARVTYGAVELLLLFTTAATTLAAALKANAWLTATLAATTVVLTGLNKVLDSHENWIASAGAWAELQVAINNYRLHSVEHRDAGTQEQLVSTVNEIIKSDTGRWASRRRSLGEGRTHS